MKISIFTPTHDTKYLLEAYDSIKDQDFDEWVILLNRCAKEVHSEITADTRVKVVKSVNRNRFVGALKAEACSHCTGDILLELDHDDLLLEDALDEVREAFTDAQVGFVYSNCLLVKRDGSKFPRFNPAFNWQWREVEYNGQMIDEPISFSPTPASISRIWFAPDHLRAFRKEVYDKVGGYNSQLEVLDDQDLMCRLYLETKFHHINKPLYVYRIHDANTWLQRNKKIQDGVYPIYHRYIELMALKWAEEENYEILDLGGRVNSPKGYTTVDIKDADVIADLNTPWPFEDGTVGVVRAFDVFEHLKNPIFTMKELYRVLAPGGYAFIQVPSTDGRGAFQDPTHASFWNENSFKYYTQKQFLQYIEIDVKFQIMALFTSAKNKDGVCWVIAHLVKMDESVRLPGPTDLV